VTAMLQDMTLNKVTKRLLMMFLVLLLLFLLALSARTGVSYVAQYRAHTAVTFWQQSLNNKPSLSQWQDMLDLVETMLVFDDKNPELLNVRGRLYFYRARNMADSVKESLQDYKHAMVDYRAVIGMRPAWPYAYLSLLYSKVLSNELDAEMIHSLLRVIQLSPWEKASVSDTVKAAVFVWPSLDTKTQQLVRSYLLQVSDKRKGEFRSALKESQLSDYFCKNIANNNVTYFCH